MTLLIRALLSLLFISFSAEAIGLSCPGPDGFISTRGKFWGWSWELSPTLSPIFSYIDSSWTFTSPYEDRFSTDYPLTAWLCNCDIDQKTDRVTAYLICSYTLAGGQDISVQTHQITLNMKEFATIMNSWNKQTKHYIDGGDAEGPVAYYDITGYECYTTAGAPDKCSINPI